MTRMITVVFALALLFASQAAAQGWRAFIPQVKVSSPLLHQLGIRPSGHNMVVTNGTSLYCRIVAYGKEIVTLGPGDAAYDDRHFEPLQAQIPVAALCYNDPRLQNYAGSAGAIFQLSGGGYGYANSVSWTIRRLSVIEWERTETEPGSGPRTRKVKFPREWWNGTGGVQIVNNTPYEVTVRVSGRDKDRLRPTELCYVSAKDLGNYGGEVGIQLIFLTRGGEFIGTTSYLLYVPANGVYIQQYIVSEKDIFSEKRW